LPPVALPIELLVFNAKMKENFVALNWTTASEINNDYFTIEKSVEKVNFMEVTRMKGAGNSSNILNYNAVDREPYPGISYYRLKQTDFDGKYTYSRIVAVDMDRSSSGYLSIYLNPASTQITVNASGFNGDESTVITVVNVLGEILHQENVSAIKQGTAATDRFVVNIKELPKGIYFVRVQLSDSDAQWIGKFVKN